jgi:hypothetical protein
MFRRRCRFRLWRIWVNGAMRIEFPSFGGKIVPIWMCLVTITVLRDNQKQFPFFLSNVTEACT